jgi:hypothetical protein
LQTAQSQAAASLAWRRKAQDWFVRSGIQDASGGVSRYLRGDTGVRLPNSTEITGYAISGLLMLGLDDAARRAADFLVEEAWDADLQLFPFELEGSPRLAYFFDSGIIARGLMRLAEATDQEKYWIAAEAAARSMLRDFPAEQGYHPILELPSRTPVPYTAWWSRRPGGFHLKAALAWRELWGPEDPDYARLLRFALESVGDLLAGETDDARRMDRLHPYCYFLEGLMPVARGHAGVLAAGIAEVAAHLHRLAPAFCRSDVFAQLLRIRLLADAAGVAPLDESAAAREAEALADLQLESEDPRLDGAFAFGRREGRLIPHANPVSTIFAAQALAWWQDYQRGEFAGGWRELI